MRTPAATAESAGPAPGPQSGTPSWTSPRRLMWVLLAIGLVALPLASLPGRYVFDTRDPLWLNPAAYLSKAFALWHQSPYLGHEQHDAIAFPMGLAAWLIRLPGISAWAAERIWHGLLLFAGTAFTILLVDHLRGRRTVAAPLAAGLTYSLTPYTFGYGLPFTGPYLPYVLLPLLLLVTLKGIGRRGLLWPALFGLTTFLMGGGNGAPQIYALITAVALMAWVALVQRAVGIPQALRFAAWAGLFVLGLNAWWLVLLRSSEVGNAIAFSEQPNIINVSSSASETIRGLGFWMFYGGDQFGPWVPTVRAYATDPLLILTGFAVPVGALASAWLVRWRYRLFFLFLLVISVFVAAGVFPVSSPTPFGRLLLHAYRSVPGAAGLRTTYKFAATLNLAVAVLVGVGVGALVEWLRRMPRPRLVQAGALAAVFLVIGANAYPLWTGRLYSESRSTSGIPGYWKQAISVLASRDTDTRAFFAPAAQTAVYRWGMLKEGVAASAPGALAHVDPIRLPVGERFGSNLVAAVEQPYFEGLTVAGEAQLFRYLGVRDVVLQNDLDWQRSHTARPANLQALTENPAIQPFTSFGVPPSRKSKAHNGKTATERSLAPVQVLTVTDPTRIVRAEPDAPVVVSGDGFGLAEAARVGLLADGPPVLYSGSLSSGDLDSLVQSSHPSFVVTDTNRREVWSFTTPRETHSYTYAATASLGNHDAGYGLFGSRTATQSVAVYPGLRSVSASAYGSPLRQQPEFRPAEAFDGDPSTAWEVGQGEDPTGNWIKATFEQAHKLSSVRVAVPSPGLGRQIQTVRLEFSDGTSVTGDVRPGKTTTIRFRARSTTFLRVRILGLTRGVPGSQNAVSISEIGIHGLHPVEIVRVPTDLFDAIRETPGGLASMAGSPLTYLFERARTGKATDRDEETVISRQFEVPGSRRFGFSGTAHLNPAASDDLIDQALIGPTPVTVTSSSRLFGAPQFRGSAAFDGNPATEWIPRGTTGESLKITFPRRRIGSLSIDTDLAKTRSPILQATVTFADGSTAVGKLKNLLDGTMDLSFKPRATSSVKVTIDSILAPNEARPRPVAIEEVHIPGVKPLRFDDSAKLPCSPDSTLTLDGLPYPVKPAGTQGDLLSGEDLPLGLCFGGHPPLSAGTHTLLAGGVIQADSLELTSAGNGGGPAPAPATSTLPSLRVNQGGEGGFQVDVANATAPYYLVIGQNVEPGWRASIGGSDLGPPELLDGYSAGWFVNRVGSYRISVRYGPQRSYDLALALSAFTLGVALVLVAREARRRRRPS